MKRRSRSGFLVLASLVALVPLLQGSTCMNVKPITDTVTDSVDKINTTMSDAVNKLDTQSSAWQQTLKDLQTKLASDAQGLESKIASDVQNVITQIDTVVKDGLQFGQEMVNCQMDIFAKHASIAVQNLKNDFLNSVNYKGISNRPSVPHAPIVCSANPTGINTATWNPSTFLVLSGTDLNLLDTSAPTIVAIRANGSQVVMANMGNRETNYRFAVNVPAMIAQRLLPTDAVKLEIRWNGQRVNQNEIPVAGCGLIGGPCCGGSCAQGACVNSVCMSCGHLGEACCTAGSECVGSGVACLNHRCDMCGGLGQACCPNSACTAVGTGCLTGRCTSCPAAPKLKALYHYPGEQAGPHCWPESGSDYVRAYGGPCEPNYHRSPTQPPPHVNVTCDSCSATGSWKTNDPADCTYNVHFVSPQDCFKRINVDVDIWEQENAPPHPTGCP